MGYSRKLGPPIVAAAVATIALTNFATITIVKVHAPSNAQLFGSIWPIALTSAVAIILVMSFLYRSLVELVLELERREKEAQHEAVHDKLTGLANRALLEDRLQVALGRFRRDRSKFALLMLDLDRFKLVNDSLGHAAGDLLVQQVGGRLTALLRETDTVARIGGDEFAIIQSEPRGEGDVRRLCARIIDALGQPFHLNDREARVGVSVGAILPPEVEASASELIRKADITMYEAKAAGRNCYRLFSDEMDLAVQRRNLVEKKLREALDSGTGLDLHYQPQLSVAGAVIGVEGLLRWKDSDLGDISPAEIIPIAEESSLIDDLGELTFRQACRSASKWPQITVAVNLSPLQFRRRELPILLHRIAEEEGVECNRIEIEVTENLLIEHADICAAAMSELRALGFRLSLDDFGTGYSSLSYLRRFPVDKIKLDRSFIDSADRDQSISIIRAAVTLGHALGLEVIAEGISTAEQELIALEAGCDALQGYRYAPAMPEDELSAFLAGWTESAFTKAA
jgi:diguanylate cyclase (GGDEF)-like protein